jgi:p24 family protein delta-1
MKSVFLLVIVVYAYEILLDSSEKQCFGEDMMKDTLYIAETSLKDQGSNKFYSVSVTDKANTLVHFKEGVKTDKFSFFTVIDGPHILCIKNLETSPILINLKIDTGVAAKDYSSLPTAKEIKMSERKIKRIHDSVIEIKKELQYIKDRDYELEHTNETIQKRIIIYSGVSLLLLIVLAVTQVMYLKKYFKSKKMI